jgi:hypothetical protein
LSHTVTGSSRVSLSISPCDTPRGSASFSLPARIASSFARFSGAETMNSERSRDSTVRPNGSRFTRSGRARWIASSTRSMLPHVVWNVPGS